MASSSDGQTGRRSAAIISSLRSEFLDHTHSDIARLWRGIDRLGMDASLEPRSLAALAHRIRGSAALFGEAALSDAAAALEHVLSELDDPSRQAALPAVRRQMARLTEAVDAIDFELAE